MNFVGGGRPGFRFFYWIGRAGVAWFPLAPGEAYVPPYRCTPGYRANLNASNQANPKYINLTAPGAVTAVPRDVFVQGQPVAEAAVQVSMRDASQAVIEGSEPPVAPVERSLSPRRDRFVLSPPPGDPGATVVGRGEAGPLPIPFGLRQPILDLHPGRPLDPDELAGLRGAAGEAERSDVLRARLGALERKAISAPVLARTPEEAKRRRDADVKRSTAIRRELRRAH